LSITAKKHSPTQKKLMIVDMISLFKKILALFIFNAGILSCTSSTNIKNQAEKINNQQITDTILQKMNQYADALNHMDSAAWLNCYVAGDEFRLYSDGKVLSYEEMKTIAGGLKNGFSSVHVSWDTILVTLPSNTVALATAPFHRKLVDTAGNIIQDRGVANWLFVKSNGQWKMFYGHGDHYPEQKPEKK
jgi:hypothetical protein